MSEISTKTFEFEDPAEATRNYLVWSSKLRDMFRANPVFWYSVGLRVNEKNKHELYVDTGKINKIELNVDDIEVPK